MLIEGEFESDLSKAVDNEVVANQRTNCEVSNCSLVTHYSLRFKDGQPWIQTNYY